MVSRLSDSSFLRLYGSESLSSCFDQSLVGRRVQAHHIQAGTCVEFDPVTYQQLAGLVCYYNTYHYHYLNIYGNDGRRKLLGIISCDKYVITEPAGESTDITGINNIYLKVDFDRASLQFYYATDPEEWKQFGPVLDGSILSDDYVRDENVRYRPAFTGTFVGLCCQDLSGRNKHADFEWFEYKEIK